MGYQGSAYDTLKLLAVFGGIPWYLEQASSGMTADNIIKQLCFEKDGMLVSGFNNIFHDLFSGKDAVYKRILGFLRNGMKTLAEIRMSIEFAHSGTLSQMMEHLITAGFVTKQSLWSFKTLEPLKQSLYRICDPYMRFYLKVIEVNQAKIDSRAFEESPLSSLPGFEAHMGLQLEYLLLQNRPMLLKAIGISPADITCDGPYRQSQTARQKGCQIDYLVQTLTKNLFVWEFKFKRRELGAEVVVAMQDRIKSQQATRLSLSCSI